MRKATLLLLLILVSFFGYSQNDPDAINYSQQLELRHDNDFFLFLDQYYTSGLFLTYRKSLKKGIFSNSAEQISISAGQEIYTPKQKATIQTTTFDRPYAGFLGLHSGWSMIKNGQFYEAKLLLGYTGKETGGGGFQRWYHKITGFDSPLWVKELNATFHTNMYLTYAKEYQMQSVPFGASLAIQPKLAAGSRDIYAENAIALFLGKRNTMQNSSRYNRWGGKDDELFVTISLTYRYVFYNGLIEGNLFGDDSRVLRAPEKNLFKAGIDLNHQHKRNSYHVGVHFNTKETPKAKAHAYVQVAYAYAFK